MNEKMYRTVILNIRQSHELSKKIDEIKTYQRYFYNLGVEKGFEGTYSDFDLYAIVTKLHQSDSWTMSHHTNLAQTAILQGYNAVMRFKDANNKKRSHRKYWKNRNGKNHKWWINLKNNHIYKNHKLKNNWRDAITLFKKSKYNDASSITSNGAKPSIKMGKWKKIIMNLPGVGNVQLLEDIDNLPNQLILGKKNSHNHFEHNMASFQLVENTIKITSRTKPENRTYKLHVTVKIDPESIQKTENTNVIGIDIGVKHSFVTSENIDDKESYNTYDLPTDCRRQKNDEITIIQSSMSKCKKGSRHWTNLHYEKQKCLKKIRNQQTDFERKTVKNIVLGAGIVCKEKLKIGSMTNAVRKSTGLNREISRGRLGSISQRIIDTVANTGGKILETQPHYTSITCCKCNHTDKKSRVTRDVFKCVKYKYEIDADMCASTNIRMYNMPCIKRQPAWEYHGKYNGDNNNDKDKNNNHSSNITKHNTNGIISGGWGDHRKTEKSKDGLHRSDSIKLTRAKSERICQTVRKKLNDRTSVHSSM